MLKKISQEQLEEILRSNAQWLAGKGGEQADLSYLDLMGAVLTYANLTYANLRDANLADANLTHANLTYANLRDANLADADLTGADLRGADLRGADLRGANLTYADLRGADLMGAVLRGANLTYAKIWDTNLGSSKISERWVVLSQIGSRRGTTYYDKKNDIVRCGCFSGTLNEFEQEVEQVHKDNPVHLAEYRAAITYIKAICAIEG